MTNKEKVRFRHPYSFVYRAYRMEPSFAFVYLVYPNSTDKTPIGEAGSARLAWADACKRLG